MLRVTHTRETQFKKNQAGSAPAPTPAPAPAGRPVAAVIASGGARVRGHGSLPIAREKLQVPKVHALCSQFSLFKHYELPSHGQCGTKCL